MRRSTVDGQPSELDAAVAVAAGLLRAARQPLVYGLLDSTVEAQRAAVAVARRLGAILDTPASASHAGSFRAFERLGAALASRGEYRHAELAVFWACGSDASELAPRPGLARVSVDVGSARGPADADTRLALEPDQEIPALLALRAFARGRRVDAAQAGSLPVEALRSLARRLVSCGYGVVVCDADPAPARRDACRADALTALVRECHRKSRVRLSGLRRGSNPVGAENVLTWLTGFPASVRFGADGPRYGPGEFAAETLLQRGDVDAVLLVGVEPEAHLSNEAAAQLARVPCVALGAVEREGARVFLATSAFGATAGRVFRGDGVALRHAPPQSSDHPSEATVLARLAEALAS